MATAKETDTGICSKSDGRMHAVARRKKQSGRRDPGVIFPGGPFHQKQGRAGMGAQNLCFQFGCQHGGK